MAATERTVRVASIAYIDSAERFQRGSFGESVNVHASDLARFDEFNRLPGDPVATPESEVAPEKKPTARRKATE